MGMGLGNKSESSISNKNCGEAAYQGEKIYIVHNKWVIIVNKNYGEIAYHKRKSTICHGSQ